MAGLGDLVIKLHADIAQFSSDMGRAAHVSEREWGRVRRSAGEVLTQIAVASAIAAVAMVKFGKNVIDTADELAKMSQQVGVSVESLSALQYSADLAGVSNEQLSVGLKQLAKNMQDTAANTGEARLAFTAMGLSAVDANGNLKSTETMLLEVADQFSGMEDSAGKTALAMKIFGKSGAALIPMLNEGAEGLKRNSDEARRFGLIISTDVAKKAEKFNDDMLRVASSIRGVGIEIISNALPSLNKLVEQMLVGTQIAGGFFTALRLFGLSTITSSNAGEKIKEITKEIEANVAARDKAIAQGRTKGKLIANYDAEIVDLKKQLEFAKFLQRQVADELGKDIGRDEASRYAKPKKRAPGLPDEAAMRAAAADALKTFELIMAGEEEFQRESAEAWKFWADSVTKQNEAALAAGQRDMQAWFDMIDREQEEAVAQGAILAADITEQHKKSSDEITEFWKSAAKNMQSGMSDFFFGIMQGELSDLAGNFKRTIDKMVADVLAAQAATKLFGTDFGKGGDIGGLVGKGLGFFSGGDFGIGNLFKDAVTGASLADVAMGLPAFASGTDFVPRTGLALVHQGEAITKASENTVRGSRGGNVNVSMTVYAQDANSFNASRGQILADLHHAGQVAFRRDR